MTKQIVNNIFHKIFVEKIEINGVKMEKFENFIFVIIK